MADLRPPLAPALAGLGQAATVTPKGGAPVATRLIVAGVPADEPVLDADPEGRPDHRYTVAIPTVDVPVLPLGSTLKADLDGSGPRTWTVEWARALGRDELRALVTAAD
jgi:hypothetical protein